jgi:mRNA-degrading endonuclease YafQ of YafQ-DinJ toxin-antitoxin module
VVDNPVRGYSISKSSKYKKECKNQERFQSQILRKELNIVGLPEYEKKYHEPLHGKCEDMRHARVDDNFRIIYSVDHKHRIIFLKRMVLHKTMERICN